MASILASLPMQKAAWAKKRRAVIISVLNSFLHLPAWVPSRSVVGPPSAIDNREEKKFPKSRPRTSQLHLAHGQIILKAKWVKDVA